MTRTILVLVSLALPAAVLAQRPVPPQGLNGRTMAACKPDIERFCSRVSLQQECLVAHWAKLSDDCQDALASPMRGGGD